MSALLLTDLPLMPPTTSVFSPTASLTSYSPTSHTAARKSPKKEQMTHVKLIFLHYENFSVMFPHIFTSSPLKHTMTQLLVSSHSWLIEGREMQIWRDRSDPWYFAACRIVLVLLNCGGKIAGGHDLDGDLSNPIASSWSPSWPGHAIRADNVL